MDIVKDFITSRKRIEGLKRQNARLKRENVRLKAQLNARQPRKPTVADRTTKKEHITPEQVLVEYLYGKEAVNG